MSLKSPLRKKLQQIFGMMMMQMSAKAKALRAVNLIKEKCCGKIKGRHCAGGCPQQDWYKKYETSCPTISLDALFATLLIDVFEGCDVVTADVAGTYLNAFMNNFILVKLIGKDVEFMSDVSPEFSDAVEKENRQPVLYLQLDRALYSCVQSVLLWCKSFTKTLVTLGCELNPYDTCVDVTMVGDWRHGLAALVLSLFCV